MPHVVCEPCVNCRNTFCCVVCPVEAFRKDTNMLVIDPDVCIDCGACVGECPVQAIYPDGDVPAQWAKYVALNKEKAPSLPSINTKQEPLKK
jgi:ferredoxin